MKHLFLFQGCGTLYMLPVRGDHASVPYIVVDLVYVVSPAPSGLVE